MRNTREKIMDVAEHCFAHRGIATSSIRTIVKEAGVNLGAVTYHFGSKDDLIIEIFKRRMLPMTQERLDMLESAREKAGDRPLSLRAVLEAIIVPQRRVARKYPEYIEFLSRMRAYPNPRFHEVIDSEFNPIFQVFNKALRETLPPMSDSEFSFKMFFFVHLLESVPENSFHLKQLISSDLNDGAVIEAFVSFTMGGLEIPFDSLFNEHFSFGLE